jgi:hypothetical protein
MENVLLPYGLVKTAVQKCTSSRVFRRMKQYDWLRNGIFSGWGLHYGQDLSCGALQAWINE